MDTWELLAAERRSLAAELSALTPEQWQAPSQCDDWTVRDVAAHVAMTPFLSVPRVLPTMLRYRFDIPRVISALARSDRRTPPELIAALCDSAGARGTPPKATGSNVLADIVLHGQDIRRPLGLGGASSIDALLAAAQLLAHSDFNCGSATRSRGLGLVATDVTWSHGDGPQVRGPLHALVEAIGGRSAAVDDLSGEGVSILAARCPARSLAASMPLTRHGWPTK